MRTCWGRKLQEEGTEGADSDAGVYGSAEEIARRPDVAGDG